MYLTKFGCLFNEHLLFYELYRRRSTTCFFGTLFIYEFNSDLLSPPTVKCPWLLDRTWFRLCTEKSQGFIRQESIEYITMNMKNSVRNWINSLHIARQKVAKLPLIVARGEYLLSGKEKLKYYVVKYWVH